MNKTRLVGIAHMSYLIWICAVLWFYLCAHVLPKL